MYMYMYMCACKRSFKVQLHVLQTVWLGEGVSYFMRLMICAPQSNFNIQRQPGF